jgi:endogenous inhibitor of DNA gyrase (YacG/DUF329 family)
MLTFDCPWCEEAASLLLPAPEDPETSVTCAECGTTIDWAEEPVAFDLAA